MTDLPDSVPARPRVLVVEDYPLLGAALGRFLRWKGCDVEGAADGAEGLEKLARDHFDAVVSDVHMPKLDGTAFYDRAVALHPYLRRRFLFCSALPPPPSLVTDPAVRFFAKPFELSDLWATLSEIVRTPPPPEA
ncbi:MAG: response regulator [Gemmatimonadetes bacterium]|nr:response regulator [Gemmatimonadota bacterium]